MRFWTLVLLFAGFPVAGQRMPMETSFPDSAAYRWLNKKVLESRLLDDMESLDRWSFFGRLSAEVADARVARLPSMGGEWPVSAVAEMTLTRERSRDGGQSLRLRMPTRLNMAGPANGRAWGTAECGGSTAKTGAGSTGSRCGSFRIARGLHVAQIRITTKAPRSCRRRSRRKATTSGAAGPSSGTTWSGRSAMWPGTR